MTRSILPLLVFLALALPWARGASIEWPREMIRASVARDDVQAKIGQYLQLQRKLKEGYVGWQLIRLDLPESWKIANLEIENDGVKILLVDRRLFRVSKKEIGPFTHRLGQNRSKGDEAIEKLWLPFEKKG